MLHGKCTLTRCHVSSVEAYVIIGRMTSCFCVWLSKPHCSVSIFRHQGCVSTHVLRVPAERAAGATGEHHEGDQSASRATAGHAFCATRGKLVGLAEKRFFFSHRQIGKFGKELPCISKKILRPPRRNWPQLIPSAVRSYVWWEPFLSDWICPFLSVEHSKIAISNASQVCWTWSSFLKAAATWFHTSATLIKALCAWIWLQEESAGVCFWQVNGKLILPVINYTRKRMKIASRVVQMRRLHVQVRWFTAGREYGRSFFCEKMNPKGKSVCDTGKEVQTNSHDKRCFLKWRNFLTEIFHVISWNFELAFLLIRWEVCLLIQCCLNEKAVFSGWVLDPTRKREIQCEMSWLQHWHVREQSQLFWLQEHCVSTPVLSGTGTTWAGLQVLLPSPCNATAPLGPHHFSGWVWRVALLSVMTWPLEVHPRETKCTFRQAAFGLLVIQVFWLRTIRSAKFKNISTV